jgi:hypothetical protein
MGLLHRNREPKVIIDLRDPASAPTSSSQWGSPVPCPECSGRGYLDHIDPFKEIMYLHCTRCTAKYELSRAELDGVTT